MVFFSSSINKILELFNEINYILYGSKLHFTAISDDTYNKAISIWNLEELSMDKDKRKLTEKVFIRSILELFGVVFLHTALAPTR